MSDRTRPPSDCRPPVGADRPRRPGVLIGNPSRQHSHHLAAGLHGAGILDSLCCGQFREDSLTALPSWLRPLIPEAVWRNAIPSLGPGLVTTLPIVPFIQRLTRWLPGGAVSQWGEWIGFWLFDKWFSWRVRQQLPIAVIGYESCCLRAFKIAKDVGALCILDAAACHFTLQDSRLAIHSVVTNGVPGRLVRSRKAAEIDLADLVVCPSSLSADSYRAAGIDASKVRVVSLGVDLKTFASAVNVQRIGPVRFAFIGNSGYVKGFDILLAAVSSLKTSNGGCVLEVVGAIDQSRAPSGGVQLVYHGMLPRNGVLSVLSRSDCLVLPSRLESFGMVVLEALASGIPVIVSRYAGASAIIQDGVNGWVVEPNQDEVGRRIEWCMRNLPSLRSMRGACLETARKHQWKQYQLKIVQVVQNAIAARSTNTAA